MKKLVYLVSVFFFLSCGSEPKTTESNHHDEKKKVEVKEEKKEEVKVEEPVEEAEVVFDGDATLGETLFTDKGCVACHQADGKLVGPSLKDISAGYAGNGDAIVSFLKEEGDPIIEPEQYEVMKANFAVTKELSDEELKGLAAFILTH